MTAEDWLPTIEIYLPEQFDEIRTAIEQLVTENASLKATLEREVDLCKRVMVERDGAVERVARLKAGFLRHNPDTGQIECLYCHLCSDDETAVAHTAKCVVREGG